jgi:hypothetical protein
MRKQNPYKKIKKHCLDCCGHSTKTVKFCPSINCNLWYLRFGMQAKQYVKENGEKYKELFDTDNFKGNGIFSSKEHCIEDIQF